MYCGENLSFSGLALQDRRAKSKSVCVNSKKFNVFLTRLSFNGRVKHKEFTVIFWYWNSWTYNRMRRARSRAISSVHYITYYQIINVFDFVFRWIRIEFQAYHAPRACSLPVLGVPQSTSHPDSWQFSVLYMWLAELTTIHIPNYD